MSPPALPLAGWNGGESPGRASRASAGQRRTHQVAAVVRRVPCGPLLRCGHRDGEVPADHDPARCIEETNALVDGALVRR
jgi:hypothetical protein